MTRPRPAQPSLTFIDDHCAVWRDHFQDVRTFEHFKGVLTGLLSELPRKSLPALARFLGEEHSQGLHHLLVTPHVSTAALREIRLELVRQALRGQKVTLIVDETGDRKKGKTTDYVARQYLGSVGKVDNGIVSVHVVALVDFITFPLLFEVFKPQGHLREGDVHRPKTELAMGMLRQIQTWDFAVERVVADSLYGECKPFRNLLEKFEWPSILALRDNHSVRLPPEDEVYELPWQEEVRHLSEGSTSRRWVREVVFGRPRGRRYFVLTSDPETLPPASTSFVTTASWESERLVEELPDAYGTRTWVEDVFRQAKSELGWHDYRLTRWEHIERWWELVLCAYTLVSLWALARHTKAQAQSATESTSRPTLPSWPPPPGWNTQPQWKATLNALRSVVTALGALLALLPWVAWMQLGTLEPPLLNLLLQLRTADFPY